MPPILVRKVLICATADGLVIQPLHGKKDQRSPLPVRIKYGDASISSAPRDAVSATDTTNTSFEAFGIVGLLTVFRFSYLVSVTRRKQVAQLHGCPIFVVTEVALTPCSSHKDASQAVAATAGSLCKCTPDEAANESDTAPEDDFVSAPSAEAAASSKGEADEEVGSDDSGCPVETGGKTMSQKRSSVAEDVIGRKGTYGRFAQRWFSRSGWAMGQKRSMGLSENQLVPNTNQIQRDVTGKEAGNLPVPDERHATDAAIRLFPRFLRSTQTLLGGSRSFFFSYDYDITWSLGRQRVPHRAPYYDQVNPEFFWNQNIIQPFVDAGLASVALPLMQGFVGQRSFVVDRKPPQTDSTGAKDSDDLGSKVASDAGKETVENGSPSKTRESKRKYDITVISRRSIHRAGLRYLRRGIDENGHVANSVETEQILLVSEADGQHSPKMYSFVQIRGSIPLFFTQSPYSFKPAPYIRHSPDANHAALSKHIERVRQEYGALQIVNLVEKHGVEATVGNLFQEYVAKLNKEATSEDAKVPFEWFDFHDACRGMKFENVAILLQTMASKLETLGSTLVSAEGGITARQSGVLRTNCMDCLDRTNVCQSSFARFMLDTQLRDQGIEMAAQLDQENTWFNTLWADNGDAISKQYASTGAMKGDYTRTRKRNWRGELTDAGLSLTRLFNGMFNDFFLQATIDYLLGNVTSLVFEEFEVNMMTKDPAVSMQRMREQAIELCQKRVIADESEEFVGGWTFLTPHQPGIVKTQSFEEAVLLLTDVALYLCRFDWDLDKVSSFERVDLAHVCKIAYGTYITSTVTPAQADEVRNVGLVVEYRPGKTNVTRHNTRSLSSSTGGQPTRETQSSGKVEQRTGMGIAGFLGLRAPPMEPPHKIALKASYSQTSLAEPAKAKGDDQSGIARLTEIQHVVLIVAEIERLAIRRQPALAGKKPEEARLVEKAGIISLAEAKRNTGYLEQLGYTIKKLVWA